MRAIFISYRRNDAEGEAGRLFDDLVREFGENSVFMDVAAIEAGRDFRKAIDESVATCGVLLAVIGREWTETKNETGQRRLDDPSDFVRLETVSALKRDIPVIPVLVHGARMPRTEQLPDDLKDLAYRNGVELAHTRWNSDLQLLIKALRPYVEDRKGEGRPQPEPEPKPIPPPSPDDVNKKKPSWLTLAAVAIGVVAIGIIGYMLVPKGVTVPDLTGSTLSVAISKLRTAHLSVGRKTYQQDTQQPPETVLAQTPSANATAKSGTPVDLVLSQPSNMVEVPALVGKPFDAARQALQDLRLRVGSVSHEPRSDVARNTVLDEFPKPGKKVDPGTAVDLAVADAAGQQTSSQPRCLQGYVWREASPNDHVCVTPGIRAETLSDNAQAAARRLGNGPYGPDTCKQGYVWRDAFPNDHVCVPPATRSQAAADNAAGPSRVAKN